VTRSAVDGHGVAAFADRLEDRSFGIELPTVLIVVGHLDVYATAYVSFVRRQIPQEQPEQRRLSRAIRPNETDSVAAHDTS
jgi:hypothetical protein